jgi:thiol-disulfide isomerase/thioredoxin
MLTHASIWPQNSGIRRFLWARTGDNLSPRNGESKLYDEADSRWRIPARPKGNIPRQIQMRRIRRIAFPFVLCISLALSAAAAVDDATLASLRKHALAGEYEPVRAEMERLRPKQKAVTPEWLAAVSWAARAAGAAEKWSQAVGYADEAYSDAFDLIDRPAQVDSSPHLATAVGAAIEVLGRAHDASGDRPAAIAYLHEQREKFRGTSIEERIQKNYLLISLEGKPMPELDAPRHIGPRKPPAAADLRGKVTVFFFWAHWCSDCRQQRPILIDLYEKYNSKGLVIVGPTRLYGYISKGTDAAPEAEFDYIVGEFSAKYPIPEWMPVPVSAVNFADFGVSSTPTLVVVDRKGIVRLYHPGRMTQEELEPVLLELLDEDAS